MRLPRTRKAWALPLGFALGIVAFWGSTVVANAVVPSETDPLKHWVWFGTMLTFSVILRRFGAWYSRPR